MTATRTEIPHHVNPPNQPPDKPIARAPYNFVPLPQAIFEVASLVPESMGTSNKLKLQPDPRFTFSSDGEPKGIWECHDRYIPGTHSGWIELSIEALTPIFIRGPVTRDANGDWDTRDSRLRSAPFLDLQDRPLIPGSTLRGMLRNLVEILSYSKIQPVSNKRPFFRNMNAGAYRDRFTQDLGQLRFGTDIGTLRPVSVPASGYEAKVRAGIVRIDGSRRWIEECGFARVQHSDLQSCFGGRVFNGTGPGQIPNPSIQHARVTVTADRTPEDYFFHAPTAPPNRRPRHPDLYLRFRRVQRIARPTCPAEENGMVVITGNMQQKHLEFVFLLTEANGSIEIPDSLWQRFHDDDQISQWQEQAFPRRGHLGDGTPVFLLCDDSLEVEDNPQGLVFFGRAQMFRFPYDRTPAELVPEHLRSAGLDMAEAMFGRVKSAGVDPLHTIKGRVFCEDCTASGDGQWLESEIVPQILGSPKVTAYQQYLTQDGSQHRTYLAEDASRTTIRGHKFYWHRWDVAGLQDVRTQPIDEHNRLLLDLHRDKPTDTQHTLARPVRSGVTFTGRIRFENLTDIELGALLAALDLPDGCAHKIGMAKPLGLGSIRITPTLNLIDRATRYSGWQTDGIQRASDKTAFLNAFATAIVNHGKHTGEATITANAETSLHHLARLDALFTMLRWEGKPPRDETRYMKIEGGDKVLYPEQSGKVNEFRTHPILPTPHAVAGGRGPQWASNEPDWPGPIPEPAGNRKSATDGVARGTAAPVAKSSPARFEKGGIYTAKAERVKKGKLQVRVEFRPDDFKFGFIENTSDVPESLRTPDSTFRVRLEQPPAANCTFRYMPDT